MSLGSSVRALAGAVETLEGAGFRIARMTWYEEDDGFELSLKAPPSEGSCEKTDCDFSDAPVRKDNLIRKDDPDYPQIAFPAEPDFAADKMLRDAGILGDGPAVTWEPGKPINIVGTPTEVEGKKCTVVGVCGLDEFTVRFDGEDGWKTVKWSAFAEPARTKAQAFIERRLKLTTEDG